MREFIHVRGLAHAATPCPTATKRREFFGQLNRRGVPVAALWGTGSVSGLAFLSNYIGDQKIYQLFYNASSLSGFLIWLGIAVCHLRFRKAWVAQGRTSTT